VLLVAVGRDTSVPRRQTRLQVGQVLPGARTLRVVVCARLDRPRSLHRHLSPDAQSPVDGRQRPPSLGRSVDRRHHLRHTATGHLRLRRVGAGGVRRLRLLGQFRAGVDPSAVHNVVRRGRLRRSAAAARRHLRPHLFRGVANCRLGAAASVLFTGGGRRLLGQYGRRRRPVHAGRQASSLRGRLSSRRTRQPGPM